MFSVKKGDKVGRPVSGSSSMYTFINQLIIMAPKNDPYALLS